MILAQILAPPQLVTDNLTIVSSPLLLFACLRLRLPVGFEVVEGSSADWDAVAMARQMTKTGPIYPNGYNPTSQIVVSKPLTPLKNLRLVRAIFDCG
jgi:hypothetical protein